MSKPHAPLFTAFLDDRKLAAGPLAVIAIAVKQATDAKPAGRICVFQDATGEQIDIDTRGSEKDVLQRLSPPDAQMASEPRGRGRPKLGVVSREITLLPRHWAWLTAQPGGASVTLRKLVEEARRSGKNRQRQAHDAAYRVMAALAGDRPGFEDAARALFAHDRAAFDKHSAQWPRDVRAHVAALGFADDLDHSSTQEQVTKK